MSYTQFKQGDIVQCTNDNMLHKVGDIGRIVDLDMYGEIRIKYYDEYGIWNGKPENFRLIDLDILMRGK